METAGRQAFGNSGRFADWLAAHKLCHRFVRTETTQSKAVQTIALEHARREKQPEIAVQLCDLESGSQ